MAERTLGAAVKARRLALGLSQDELAARVRASGIETFRQTDVSRIELDLIELPRRPRLRALAAALELPVRDLLAQAGWLDDAASTGEDMVSAPSASPR